MASILIQEIDSMRSEKLIDERESRIKKSMRAKYASLPTNATQVRRLPT